MKMDIKGTFLSVDFFHDSDTAESHNVQCLYGSLLLATKYGRTKSNLVKQTKLSSILLEPCFDFCQRKSWTSGMINYGSNKLNLEPPVSATHQQGKHISKDNH